MTKTKIQDPELFDEQQPAKAKPAKKEKGVIAMSGSGALMPSQPPAPRSMLEVIMNAVRDPSCDVAKMQALLDMQERIEERDAKKSFTRAFNALQADLPTISKDGLIDHGEGTTARGNKKLKAHFATYPNIMRVCGPLLKKHGFTLSNVIEPSADNTRIVVVGYLEHVDGHSRTSRFPLGIDTSAGKNNLQGWGSAQSYGQRYNAIALLNIVSEDPRDQDNDGFKKGEVDQSEPTTISKAEAEELRLLLKDAGLTEDRFCSGYKIESVEQLQTQGLAAAKKSIAAFKRREAEGKKNG